MAANTAPTLPRQRPLLTPLRLVVLSFACAISAGAALLSLPAAIADGTALPLVDALFRSTTAVCVTGLVVNDTGVEFSRFGQLVTLCLIQLGGLGYMTLTTMVSVLLGRRIAVGRQLAVRESLGDFGLHEVRPLLRRTLAFTLVVEGIGAALYFALFSKDLPVPLAAWYGVFHSVSSFCNAGLDLFGERYGEFCSLAPFASRPGVLLLTDAQIVLGGIGFLVVTDLLRRQSRPRICLHTRVVLRCTAVLVLVGTLVVFFLESRPSGTLADASLGGKLLQSFFTSVTCRTAGFATLPLNQMRDATLVFMCFLMFIGGSPGGTAGGLKTTTLVVVLAAVWATIRGDRKAVLFGRSVSHELVYRALTVFVVSVAVVFLCTALLLVVEEQHLESPSDMHSAAIHVFFESTSAFGTVGLSTGITPGLTTTGKLIIILTMFVGRIGPVALVTALAARRRPTRLQYPEGEISIG